MGETRVLGIAPSNILCTGERTEKAERTEAGTGCAEKLSIRWEQDRLQLEAKLVLSTPGGFLLIGSLYNFTKQAAACLPKASSFDLMEKQNNLRWNTKNIRFLLRKETKILIKRSNTLEYPDLVTHSPRDAFNFNQNSISTTNLN